MYDIWLVYNEKDVENHIKAPYIGLQTYMREIKHEGAYGMKDMAALLRRQLSGDLLLAMKAKDAVAISALRSALSALDNASAVPASTVPAPVFGRSGDVPRRILSDSDCQSIISAVVSDKSTSAEEYARLGLDDVAARLRAELAIVERYVKSGEHSQQADAAAPAER